MMEHNQYVFTAPKVSLENSYDSCKTASFCDDVSFLESDANVPYA
jgi:hypothetical protein